jgi:hypothetical protein
MKSKPRSLLIALVLVFFLSHPGSSLTSESIVRLKRAGFMDQTIQVIISEKVVETAAFSVQEIVDMKNAGISEKTIRMMVRENSFLRQRKPIIYGKDIRSIQFASAGDIIALKNAGVSDETLQAIIAVAGSRDDINREEALELLRHMNIRIDMRGERGDY